MILVDELRIGGRSHRRKWCHMVSDKSPEEMHEMARALGLPRRYFQVGVYPHYDLTPAKRREVVDLGAKQVTSRELLTRLRERWPDKD